MPRVAFHTQAPALGPPTDPIMKGFWDRTEATFESAFNSEGFIGGMRGDNGEFVPGPGFDGPIPKSIPHGSETDSRTDFYAEYESAPSTLTIWSDLESVAAFAYRGRHGEALSKRQEWFAETEYPVYVAWWIEDNDQPPTWSEAGRRLTYLSEHGPSPKAFNFKSAFDSGGSSVKLDRSTLEHYSKTVR